jgi:hypothetical protein
MKKLLLILILVASLVGCSRDEDGFLPSRPEPDLYFSRVRFYSKEYPQSTDTIWTIRVVGDSMRFTFERLNGYVYDDHSPHWIEIGRLWEKKH